MIVFKGHLADNFDEAVPLVLEEVAEREDLSGEIVRLFVPALDREKLEAEAEKSLQSEVRHDYGTKAKWSGPEWLIPVAEPRFDSLPVAQITFSIQTYLVAVLIIRTPDYIYRRTLAGAIGKPEPLQLPLIFLQSLVNGDYAEKFRITGKDNLRTGYFIPGLKQTLWLPNDFITGVSALLRRQSVAAWLLDFGSGGRKVAPLVVGTLLGWLLARDRESVPLLDRSWDKDTVIDKITQTYGSAVAAEKYQRRAHLLTASMTNREAINVILGED